jgi:hypothetical protein
VELQPMMWILLVIPLLGEPEIFVFPTLHACEQGARAMHVEHYAESRCQETDREAALALHRAMEAYRAKPDV